jgi:acetylornithine/N-succinyldiaminopimelate aminotransferase
MTTTEIQALCDQHIMNTYGTRKIALTRGDGAVLWDADGKEYIDFFAGIAVCNLGHAHPGVTAAICEQAKKLLHVSNLYYIEPQVRLAAKLAENSFAAKWFFCNGGAEANEAAIKLVAALLGAERHAEAGDHLRDTQLPRPHARHRDSDRPAQVPPGL